MSSLGPLTISLSEAAGSLAYTIVAVQLHPPVGTSNFAFFYSIFTSHARIAQHENIETSPNCIVKGGRVDSQTVSTIRMGIGG